jgi:transposase
MILSLHLDVAGPPDPALAPYLLFRDQVRPVLVEKRKALDAMYAPEIGRPEADPVLLMGMSLLQFMDRLPDRQAVAQCRFDARWRLALELEPDAEPPDASTLCRFRARLAEHDQARLVMDAGLEAMRRSGYLGQRRAVRIDSTHVLGQLALMSRLTCVRETIRMSLAFLANWGGQPAWEPWFTRYAECDPKELHQISKDQFRTEMVQTGSDLHDILTRTLALGEKVCQADPVLLLRRVFEEQFEVDAAESIALRRHTPPGSVHNPHDPEAQWSTKRKTKWVGYKLQVAETAPEHAHPKGEPTDAVITTIVVQPAITADQGSLPAVLQAHAEATGEAPQTVFADAGYIHGPALEQAQASGYELCGPVAAPPHSGKRFGSDSFAVDIPNRTATCPNGKASCECTCIAESRGRNIIWFAWSANDCSACPLQRQCLSGNSREPGRTLQVGEHHMLVQARRQLCRTPEYQRRMQQRNGIEGTQSECVRGYGGRRCRYRGLRRTQLQMQFIGAACNLRRWAKRLCWLARTAR